MGVWEIARRTASVYERFVEYEGASDLTLFACPEGVTYDSPDLGERCMADDQSEIVEFVRGQPGVTFAGRFTLALANVSATEPRGRSGLMLVSVNLDEATAEGTGRPLVVSGRLVDPRAANEATINEEMASRHSLDVGDELVVTPYRLSEFDIAGEGTRPPSGPPTRVTVVGITRRPNDLIGRLTTTSISEDHSAIAVGPAWWQSLSGDVSRYGVGVLFGVDGSTTSADVADATVARWPGRIVEVEEGSPSDDEGQDSVVDAIHLQALGMAIAALVAAGAGAVFVGQALSRQSRREWADRDVLSALGMTSRGAARASLLRSIPTAVVAVAAAAVTSVALSPLGPIGIGAAAEPDPGVRLDPFVLVVVLPILGVFVIAVSVLPVWFDRRASGRSSVLPVRAPVSHTPAGTAGWAMTSSRRRGGFALGSAVVGVAVAAAMGIAAWSLLASYDGLVADPENYGAGWDAIVGNVANEDQAAATQARLAAIIGITWAGIKNDSQVIPGREFTLVSFEAPADEVTPGVITSGRPPVAGDEIALGRASMRDLGVGIGDTVVLPTGDGPSPPLEVVGEVVVNDGMSARPGFGGVVVPTTFDELVPGVLSQSYAVWIADDADRVATLEALRGAFPTTMFEPRPPQQILNLDLIANQPVMMALVVGLLAGAALIHALVTSIRHNRRQIAVLRTIGFTRRQVASTVGWHASLLAVAALVVGVPLGVIAGRATWAIIGDRLGLTAPPVTPLAALVVVTAVVLIVANVAAAVPGAIAARISPSTTLRTE